MSGRALSPRCGRDHARRDLPACGAAHRPLGSRDSSVPRRLFDRPLQRRGFWPGNSVVHRGCHSGGFRLRRRGSGATPLVGLGAARGRVVARGGARLLSALRRLGGRPDADPAATHRRSGVDRLAARPLVDLRRLLRLALPLLRLTVSGAVLREEPRHGQRTLQGHRLLLERAPRQWVPGRSASSSFLRFASASRTPPRASWRRSARFRSHSQSRRGGDWMPFNRFGGLSCPPASCCSRVGCVKPRGGQ